MKTSKIHSLLVCLMILPTAALADPPLPDLALSSCSRAYIGPETAVLFNLPDGSGSAFTAASIGSAVVDATVTVTVLDAVGNPMVHFPFEDLWLESADGGMAVCPGGSAADDFTDEAGETTWVHPLLAGGSSQALTQVFISGSPLQSSVGLRINFNSADINGDATVNLVDLGLFAQDFFGPYAFRSDFLLDGVINLADVGMFASSLGANCP